MLFEGPAHFWGDDSVVFRLEDLPPLEQSYDQNDHGDDEKDVDQAAGVEGEQAEAPKNDEDDENRFEHVVLLYFFGFSPSCSRLRRKNNGLVRSNLI